MTIKNGEVTRETLDKMAWPFLCKCSTDALVVHATTWLENTALPYGWVTLHVQIGLKIDPEFVTVDFICN